MEIKTRVGLVGRISWVQLQAFAIGFGCIRAIGVLGQERDRGGFGLHIPLRSCLAMSVSLSHRENWCWYVVGKMEVAKEKSLQSFWVRGGNKHKVFGCDQRNIDRRPRFWRWSFLFKFTSKHASPRACALPPKGGACAYPPSRFQPLVFGREFFSNALVHAFPACRCGSVLFRSARVRRSWSFVLNKNQIAGGSSLHPHGKLIVPPY